MKTVMVALRVDDLNRSLAFYTALGYLELGRVQLSQGSGDEDCLVMLKLPEPFASLELVHRRADGPVAVGTGFDHLAVQVETLAPTLHRLTAAGLAPGPVERPAGQDGPAISWLTDPDGYRIELVEWPTGHPDGITAADFEPRP
jgi:lactoylglutathione lyase